MLSAPFSYVRKQNSQISSLYLEMEVEKLLALFEEKLRTGEIPWVSILEGEKKTIPIETLPFQIEGQKYEAKFFLKTSPLTTQEKTSYGIVKTYVQIFKKKKSLYKTHKALFVLRKERPIPSVDPSSEVGDDA